MIQLQSLAFGPFPEVEPLNRRFTPGHAKLRVTVDTEIHPSLPDQRVLERLVETFPGLGRHECRAQESASLRPGTGTPILLVEDDSKANQAHLLEHLTLEILGAFDHARRLSGVTCAYVTPPERNDVFVECTEPETGGFAAMLAVDAMNTALADLPLAPVFPDIVRCTRILRQYVSGAWPVARLAGLAGLTVERTESALDYLTRARLVELEDYAMNFSGERHYRFVGACEAA